MSEESAESQFLPTQTLKTVEDKFSKGVIVKFFPQLRYGFIKNRWGRDLYFNLDQLRFVGNKKEEFLKEGTEVGYDVARTGKGIHVWKVKVY